QASGGLTPPSCCRSIISLHPRFPHAPLRRDASADDTAITSRLATSPKIPGRGRLIGRPRRTFRWRCTRSPRTRLLTRRARSIAAQCEIEKTIDYSSNELLAEAAAGSSPHGHSLGRPAARTGLLGTIWFSCSSFSCLFCCEVWD